MPEDLRGAQRARGLAYVGLVVSLFSGFVLLSRLGLSTRLSVPDIAALRFGIGGLLLSPVLVRHGLCGLRLVEAAGLAGLGGLGFALFAYAGFALAPAAHGAILLHGTLALTTALLMRAFCCERIALRRGLSLAAIALGVATMAVDGVRQSSLSLLAGGLCLLAASFCWSSYGLYARRLGLPAMQAAAIVAGLSALAFLPVYACLPGTGLFKAGWRDLAFQAAFQGVLIGVVSVFAYTRAVALLGVGTVALFTALVPGLTTIGGYLLLGESPGGPALAGLVLTSAGLVAGLRWHTSTSSQSASR